jgi:hypothetical protein
MFTAKFSPTSNAADWSTNISFTDKATGEAIDLTGGNVPNSFTFIAQPMQNRWSTNSALVGSSATGEVTVVSLGLLNIFFPATRMNTLGAGSYRCGLTITNLPTGPYTIEVFLGLLPVLDGILGQGSISPWDYV